MNKELFLEKLISSFPQLKENILDEDYEGLLSLQIGEFRIATQQAMDEHKIQEANEYLLFIMNHFYEFDDDVQNSIVISYIQKLNFVNIPIPPFFDKIQKQLNEYYASAYSDEKLLDFLKKIRKEKPEK